MRADNYSFLFSSIDSKQPNTARKVHIRRLNDILLLSIQRHDWDRAKRAWAILARCREVDWKTSWRTSVLLISESDPEDTQDSGDRARFLSVMMRQHPDERESILKELVLHLVHAGMHKRALEELDLYLPSYPYQDNAVLHTYAGLIALYIAQPLNNVSEETTHAHGWDTNMLRDAQGHFERARVIDPSNVVAETFLGQLSGVTQPAADRDTPDSDDEKMDVDGISQVRKRIRA